MNEQTKTIMLFSALLIGSISIGLFGFWSYVTPDEVITEQNPSGFYFNDVQIDTRMKVLQIIDGKRVELPANMTESYFVFRNGQVDELIQKFDTGKGELVTSYKFIDKNVKTAISFTTKEEGNYTIQSTEDWLK